MKIIIEGPDGSGKSTVASKIHTRLGWPVIHLDKPKTEQEKQEMTAMYIQLISDPRDLILDRSWYSEMIYGPIMRGKSAISESDATLIEQTLCDYDHGLIIYCTSGDPGEMWDRCQVRGENHITSYAQYLDIARAYDDLFLDAKHCLPKRRIPVVVYDPINS